MGAENTKKMNELYYLLSDESVAALPLVKKHLAFNELIHKITGGPVVIPLQSSTNQPRPSSLKCTAPASRTSRVLPARGGLCPAAAKVSAPSGVRTFSSFFFFLVFF